MDHELMTMWLSVDPMADKYPSTSPYAYCAWNPMKLVDPDGRDVEIIKDDENKKVTIRANFYYNKKNLGSEADVFLDGFNNALKSWETDIKTALGDNALGASGYDISFEFNILESDNPVQSANNDRIGNSLTNDLDYYDAIASVTNNKHLTANLPTHSRVDKPEAWDPLFYSTTEYQGDLKHEIGHMFGLYDRYPEAKNPATYLANDLMDKAIVTRGNAVEPFKRVWKSAGLDQVGSRSVLINQNNREVW